MDLLKALLSFAVLTSPLWLILILLPVALWIAVKIAKRFKPVAVRLVWGLGVFLLIFFLPFADEIAGRIYFNHLCATEAGVKVYQMVELPAEYWDEHGKAMFFKENGDLNRAVLGDRFDEPMLTKPYSSIFRINERHQQLIDNNTHEVLGEVINFMYWGGWISRNLSPNRSATDCKEFHGNKFWNDFYSKLFKQVSSST